MCFISKVRIVACRASLPAAHQQPSDLPSAELHIAAATESEPTEGLASNAASITAWPVFQPSTITPATQAQPHVNGLHSAVSSTSSEQRPKLQGGSVGQQQTHVASAVQAPPLRITTRAEAHTIEAPLSPSASRAASVVSWPPSRSGISEGGAGSASATANLFGSAGPLIRPKRTGGVDYSCGCMDYGVRR